jgi:hypothetical protein
MDPVFLYGCSLVFNYTGTAIFAFIRLSYKAV